MWGFCSTQINDLSELIFTIIYEVGVIYLPISQMRKLSDEKPK